MGGVGWRGGGWRGKKVGREEVGAEQLSRFCQDVHVQITKKNVNKDQCMNIETEDIYANMFLQIFMKSKIPKSYKLRNRTKVRKEKTLAQISFFKCFIFPPKFHGFSTSKKSQKVKNTFWKFGTCSRCKSKKKNIHKTIFQEITRDSCL